MSWTHYWTRDNQLPADAFEKAVRDCKLVLAAIDVPLSGPDGQGEPVFTPSQIAFNGGQGQACEPFIISVFEESRRPGRPLLSYCKTERLPYDLCVQSALIILKHYLGDGLRVMSDAKDEDWRQARQLCLSCLKYGGDFELDRDE